MSSERSSSYIYTPAPIEREKWESSCKLVTDRSCDLSAAALSPVEGAVVISVGAARGSSRGVCQCTKNFINVTPSLVCEAFQGSVRRRHSLYNTALPSRRFYSGCHECTTWCAGHYSSHRSSKTWERLWGNVPFVVFD